MRKIWNKAAFGLAAATIAGTTAVATTGTAGAATATPTVQAAAAAKTAEAAATLTWPLVTQGAKGERVVAIQYLLNQRIGAGLATDGVFGPKTTAAVRTFQARSKLTADGQVGSQTWTHLIVTVQNGSKGSAVAAVQHNLRNAYGFKTLAVDGIFGPQTLAAVRSFQAKVKLPVDGIVGPTTWNALIVHE
jgi:peptidoglycan hydrolase-like protein with peptidoglycan-binding domain